MSFIYTAYWPRELPKAGIQEGDLVLYIGTVKDGLHYGPTADVCTPPACAYAYQWTDGSADEIDIGCTKDDTNGSSTLRIAAGPDQYVFVRNKARNYLRQVDGPAKPVVVGNIGADPVKVDTRLGRFLVPAGRVLRLDGDAPQRETKKVLLTFHLRDSFMWISAQLLDNGKWRSLNVCKCSARTQVMDGPFVVQNLSYGCDGLWLKDPPDDSDYEIYFRSHNLLYVNFFGLRMKDEGMGRECCGFNPKCGMIYDFQKLRKSVTTSQIEQCIGQVPDPDAPQPAMQDVGWPMPPGGLSLASLLEDAWPAADKWLDKNMRLEKET